ncbi:MAG: radical SAM protein [Myxococcaceae bacterium]|nr:radical SAM protein [Myxococcaceae bacterium]
MYTNDFNTGLSPLVEAGAIPPFVYCYPPRSSYRDLPEQWTIERIWEEDKKHSPTNGLNLYLHVPFCRYKCGFCNLYAVVSHDRSLYDRYTDALCKQLLDSARIIQERNLRTIYIGGGTPSLLSKQNFKQLFDTITSIYPNWRTVVEEVAIEASPDSITDDPEVVPFLMSCGLTRMNMGIQSLQREELREAGRSSANEDKIRKAIGIVKGHGLPNLSTDLIMGFSGQDDRTWRMSVEELASLRPETISTYFLTIRPDAWFHKTGKYEYMRDPRLYERYEYARAIFLGAGYVQESNVRYKIPGRGGYQQKVLQFRGIPYLGIGAGARTYTNTVDYLIGGSHKPQVSQVEDYIKAVNDGTLSISAGFVYSDEERIRKRLVLDNFDLNLRDLERYNVNQYRHLFEGILAEAVRVGMMVKLGEDKYQLTPKGFKYRDILSWHLYSDRVMALDREFYQTIQDKTAALPVPSDTPKERSPVSAA